MNKKSAFVAGIVMIALGGALVWSYLVQPNAAVEAPAAVDAPPVAPAATAPAAAPAASAAAPAKPPNAVEAPPTVYEALQNRLDALAKAYTAGDPVAAERAMWPNHAVTRPNGKTLDRSELIGQWMTEWESFKQRKLVFAIDEVYIEDNQVTAYWSMELTAQVLGEDGEMHDFDARGLQKAIFQRERGVDLLERPIDYHGYEQTWDGMTFKPE